VFDQELSEDFIEPINDWVTFVCANNNQTMTNSKQDIPYILRRIADDLEQNDSCNRVVVFELIDISIAESPISMGLFDSFESAQGAANNKEVVYAAWSQHKDTDFVRFEIRKRELNKIETPRSNETGLALISDSAQESAPQIMPVIPQLKQGMFPVVRILL
jgi:hypothetical protein